MLKMCANLCGTDERFDRESRKKKQTAGVRTPLDVSVQSRDVSRRTIVARQQFFKSPPQSSPLWPGDDLSYMVPSPPGNCKVKGVADVKNFPILGTPEDKRSGEIEKGTPDANITWDIDRENSDETIFSAKSFYVLGEILARPSPRNSSQNRSPGQASRRSPGQTSRRSPKPVPRDLQRRSGRRGRVKKPFVPPLPKGMCRGLDWEPNLTSIQEVSP
ncbi:hypothetical protein ACFE04_022220 [Oxalis oulophora]